MKARLTKMKNFSHVTNFTGYMRIVRDIVKQDGCVGQTILDMPAGNGQFSKALREDGFDVTSGDINEEMPNYVYVNMESACLPFSDHTFDWVICMEGIEHVISPANLVSELCRITKPTGRVIITTPNVQSFYSRLKFLFTGVLYMFEPETTRHPNGQLVDRGHISPMTFPALCYLFAEHGFDVEQVSGDKFKRKAYLPLYALLGIINALNVWRRKQKHPEVESYRFMNQREMLMSRSLITCWKKPT
jgi:SAM-dependent methyltransferase